MGSIVTGSNSATSNASGGFKRTGMQAQTNHVEPQVLGTFRHEEGLRNAGVERATFTEHSVPAGHRRIAAQRPTELGIVWDR